MFKLLIVMGLFLSVFHVSVSGSENGVYYSNVLKPVARFATNSLAELVTDNELSVSSNDQSSVNSFSSRSCSRSSSISPITTISSLTHSGDDTINTIDTIDNIDTRGSIDFEDLLESIYCPTVGSSLSSENSAPYPDKAIISLPEFSFCTPDYENENNVIGDNNDDEKENFLQFDDSYDLDEDELENLFILNLQKQQLLQQNNELPVEEEQFIEEIDLSTFHYQREYKLPSMSANTFTFYYLDCVGLLSDCRNSKFFKSRKIKDDSIDNNTNTQNSLDLQ